ncbi:MAG: hypothetical protein Q9M10_08205, partial [Mariprofundaceae bacterium]|nr:hypothetical protein [Mariprofundaceae bacterium]
MTDSNHHDPMQQLRKLLFKEEEARISAIEEVRDSKDLHAKEISEVLVEALDLRAHDEGLGKVLMPAVETAVSESIAKDPKAFADALFPVMGPAIRRSIQYAISEMLQSLNQTLEHAFSPKSLLWRWQAFRTGKPFAEVVMLNTLLYRVEQVFWIHKETGLLLAHESFDPSLTEDADLVSSMLTAVGDFIQDSFHTAPNQDVQSLRLGDLEVMVEQGPYSVLAIVCRGNPPRFLQETLGKTLENLLHLFHEDLKTFDGDTSPFAASHDMLAPLLLSDYASEEKKPPIKLIVALFIIILSLLGWQSWSLTQQHDLNQRWQQYIQTLKETPGFVITSTDNHDDLQHIYGLRDPLSPPAEPLLAKFQLNPANVRYHFQAYHALDHTIMLKRLWRLSKAPSSVSFQMKDDTLYVHGKASQAWLSQLNGMIQWVEGVTAVNVDNVSINKTFKEKLLEMLQPNHEVTVHIHGSDVVLTGFATQAWLEQSKQRMQSFKAATSYDDTAVVILDSPDYLLKLAHQQLQPPASVQLTIEKGHTLKAQGYAPAVWITQARIKVKDLSYITGFDSQSLQTLEQVILSRAITALKPPVDVHLSFKKGKLLATGKADQHWIHAAKRKALHIKGVTSFQHRIQRIWHDHEILQQASQILHPEQGVQLSFSAGVLQARGKATQAWIAFAHQEALHIEGVFTFDEQVDVIFSDEMIFKQAVRILQPPSGVHMQVSKGILSILGQAKPLWIKELKAKRTMIQGLQELRTQGLTPIIIRNNEWQLLQEKVASLHLISPSNQPILNTDDINQLKKLAQLYQDAFMIHSNSIIHIQVTRGRAEKLVASMRNQAMYQHLKAYGVPESKLFT